MVSGEWLLVVVIVIVKVVAAINHHQPSPWSYYTITIMAECPAGEKGGKHNKHG